LSLVKHSPELFHLVLDHLCGRLLANERVGATETIPEVVNLTKTLPVVREGRKTTRVSEACYNIRHLLFMARTRE
jgi:hypothetical protein